MIIDNSNGRLDEIKTYAKVNNLLESFNNKEQGGDEDIDSVHEQFSSHTR
jgi:hypothetical protein